jgi:hypothetical protein
MALILFYSFVVAVLIVTFLDYYARMYSISDNEEIEDRIFSDHWRNWREDNDYAGSFAAQEGA